MTRLSVGWMALEPPREPTAVLAEGGSAVKLGHAAVRRVRLGASLRAAARDGMLLLVGRADDLPWAEDVTYLGVEDGLLLPTLLAPDVPVDLLGQAVRQALVPDPSTPLIAMLPGRMIAFDLDDRPVDPVWLAAWATAGGTT